MEGRRGDTGRRCWSWLVAPGAPSEAGITRPGSPVLQGVPVHSPGLDGLGRVRVVPDAGDGGMCRFAGEPGDESGVPGSQIAVPLGRGEGDLHGYVAGVDAVSRFGHQVGAADTSSQVPVEGVSGHGCQVRWGQGADERQAHVGGDLPGFPEGAVLGDFVPDVAGAVCLAVRPGVYPVGPAAMFAWLVRCSSVNLSNLWFCVCRAYTMASNVAASCIRSSPSIWTGTAPRHRGLLLRAPRKSSWVVDGRHGHDSTS